MRGGGLEPGEVGSDACDPAGNKGDAGEGRGADATVGDGVEGPRDRSETDPRGVLIEALRRAIEAGAGCGDVALVQVAAEALGRLANWPRSAGGV